MSAYQPHKGSQESASVLKGEPRAEIIDMNVVATSRDTIRKSKIDSSDNLVPTRHAMEKQEPRATSPLDTIAEVACRMAISLPLTTQPGPNEGSLPENAFGDVSPPSAPECGSSESPTSIPARDMASPFPRTLSDPKDQAGPENDVSLESLLGMLRNHNLETLSNLSGLEDKLHKVREIHSTQTRKIGEQLAEELRVFKDVVNAKVGNVLEEINNVRAELVAVKGEVDCVAPQACIERSSSVLENMENGGCVLREQVVFSVKPEDGRKVSLTIRGIENCMEDGGMKTGEGMRVDANEVTISVEDSCLGKREMKTSESLSSGCEEVARGSKKMKVMCTRRETRLRKSMDVMESLCNSENSDCDYTEYGKKRVGDGDISRGGKQGSKRKVVKRKRDNWTEEENKVFMGMVLGNQEVEEMTLRRMLARRFSPRRTHEQCANHLRILRAQKKLPAAKEEGATVVNKGN